MNPAPVIEQLRGLPGVRRVDGVAEFSELAAKPNLQLPALYVIVGEEAAAEAASDTLVHQQLVTSSWSVVAMTSAEAIARAAVTAELFALREAVKTRLIGWLHPGAERRTSYRGGSLVRVGPGLIAYDLRFSARTRLRVTPGSQP